MTLTAYHEPIILFKEIEFDSNDIMHGIIIFYNNKNIIASTQEIMNYIKTKKIDECTAAKVWLLVSPNIILDEEQKRIIAENNLLSSTIELNDDIASMMSAEYINYLENNIFN